MTQADIVSSTTGGFWQTLDAIEAGDVVSSLSGGFWTGLIIIAPLSYPSIPGPKTTLTLQEVTTTKANDGSRIDTWATIQTLSSVLQRIGGKENEQYGRELSAQMWKAYISYNQFVDTNYQKLKEKNRVTATVLGISYTFDIISAEIKDAGTKGKHFEVLLEVKK